MTTIPPRIATGSGAPVATLDTPTPQPLPSHGGSAPTSKAGNGTTIWNLPEGDPARSDLDVDHLDLRVAIGRGMLFGGGAAAALGGVGLATLHADSMRSVAGWALGLGITSVIAAAFVGGGYETGHSGPYMGQLHHVTHGPNPAYDAQVARTSAAASLVGYAADDGMAKRGLVVDKVLAVTDAAGAKQAQEQLVDKPTIDAMLAGTSAGRAVVQLPTRAGDEPLGYALVQLRSAQDAAAYPDAPDDQAGAGAIAPSTDSLLYVQARTSDRSTTVGKERWIVTTTTPTVLLDVEDQKSRVMGEAAGRETGRRFDGYVTN
jgi:hypothetical protein